MMKYSRIKIQDAGDGGKFDFLKYCRMRFSDRSVKHGDQTVTILIWSSVILAMVGLVFGIWFGIIRDTSESADRRLDRSAASLTGTNDCIRQADGSYGRKIASVVRRVHKETERYLISQQLSERGLAADLNGDGDTDDTIPYLDAVAQQRAFQTGGNQPDGGLALSESTASTIPYPVGSNTVIIDKDMLMNFKGLKGTPGSDEWEEQKGLTGASLLLYSEGLCWTLSK